MWRIRVKTVGIVSGVAWPSSIAYYRTINELMARRRGRKRFAGPRGVYCSDG